MRFLATLALYASLVPSLAYAKVGERSIAPVTIPPAPVDSGQIVFFRPGGLGPLIGCSIHENGQKISSLGSGRYFIMRAQPGHHVYSVASEARDELEVDVVAGETRYAACAIKMGIIVGRPKIRPSNELEFLEEKKLKMVDEDDMGTVSGVLRPDEVAAALQPVGAH